MPKILTQRNHGNHGFAMLVIPGSETDLLQ